MPDGTRFREILDRTFVIDTHEHLRPLGELRDGPWDFIELCRGSYVAADLRSAGMTEQDWPDPDATPEDRWRSFEPWARRVRNTAYYRSLVMGCHKLHGLPEQDDVTAFSMPPLTDAMERMRRRDDLYDYALTGIGGIQVALQDPHWLPFCWQTEGDVLRAVFRINCFVMAPFPGQADHNAAAPHDFARTMDHEITGFDSYVELIGLAVEQYKQAGGIALKSSLAYDRTLDFDNVSRDDAARLYAKGADGLDAAEAKALGDYLMHAVVEAAEDNGLPVQIHTGIRAGSGDCRGANPSLLTDLIAAHPHAQFDLFHGGYPYSSELSVMAKGFPNVYLDLCWLPIISPSVTLRMLHEWLETVPLTKLLWGGDCGTVEASLGALEMAKRVIARALAERTETDRYFSHDTAIDVAAGILHDNAARLYGLS